MTNETINNGTNVNEKAAAILRARLPHLQAAALNFEKRTGNFFRASTYVDEAGAERVRRLVVADADIEQTPELTAEMMAKRAAAIVVNYDNDRAKAAEKVEEASKALQTAKVEAEQVDNDFNNAISVVEEFELPEKAARVTMAQTISNQAAEIERLKALLAEAGIAE